MITFNLKKEWFNKIKSGEKTHEYRVVKPYWTNRLYKQLTKKNFECCFKLGYPKPEENDKILYGEIIKIKVINGLESDLKIECAVYDIEFKLVRRF